MGTYWEEFIDEVRMGRILFQNEILSFHRSSIAKILAAYTEWLLKKLEGRE